jgi:hypothetical protein
VLHSARKLATIDGSEWGYLFKAQGALLWAQALVWVRPTGQLVNSEPDRADAAGAALPSPAAAPALPTLAATAPNGEPDVAQKLALGVRRAAAYGLFRPLCLVRSVALNRLLERHGVHGSRIRVGVRFVGGEFTAHAWVEHEGRVLGDDVEHVSRFASLSDVRVLKWS